MTVQRVWLGRVRFVLAVALVWGVLQFVGSGLLLPRGIDQPIVLVAARGGAIGGLALIGVLWGGAALASVALGSADARKTLMALGLGTAIWAWAGADTGTMDDWLRSHHPQPTNPTGQPYWLLVGDYLLLLLGVVGSLLLARLVGGRQAPLPQAAALSETRSERLLGTRLASRDLGEGVVALLVTAGAAGVLMFFLHGYATGQTLRGQVYFAVAVGFIGGVYAARRVARSEGLLWFALAPLLVGLLGVVVAGIKPGLIIPARYQHLDTIPAWGLARPLPIEMVSVGLVVTMWMLGPAEKEGDPERRR